jgi:hypothetical protein
MWCELWLEELANTFSCFRNFFTPMSLLNHHASLIIYSAGIPFAMPACLLCMDTQIIYHLLCIFIMYGYSVNISFDMKGYIDWNI